jgi:hypothetical protein
MDDDYGLKDRTNSGNDIIGQGISPSMNNPGFPGYGHSRQTSKNSEFLKQSVIMSQYSSRI